MLTIINIGFLFLQRPQSVQCKLYKYYCLPSIFFLINVFFYRGFLLHTKGRIRFYLYKKCKAGRYCFQTCIMTMFPLPVLENRVRVAYETKQTCTKYTVHVSNVGKHANAVLLGVASRAYVMCVLRTSRLCSKFPFNIQLLLWFFFFFAILADKPAQDRARKSSLVGHRTETKNGRVPCENSMWVRHIRAWACRYGFG